MKKDDLNKFFVEAKKIILIAGRKALESQRGIKNIGKDGEKFNSDSEYVKKRRAAKTVLDDQVQELILLGIAKVLNPNSISLDVEENTPSIKYFSDSNKKITLVIDPIDGTLEYVLGNSNYSINIGLIEKGCVLSSLVYFPGKDKFYLQKGKKVFCRSKKYFKEIKKPKKINSKIVYTNNRVSSESIASLESKGFKVIQNEKNCVMWPEALIGCLNGKIGTCIFHSPQIRDVLLGAMISSISGGYACDWRGNKIVWPSKGRIPLVMFGFGKMDSEIIKCLVDKNL